MPKPLPTHWKSDLALEAQVSLSFLCDILVGRRRPSAATAVALAKACRVLGLPARLEDWVDPEASRSPLLRQG
jgi:hypothetical protein